MNKLVLVGLIVVALVAVVLLTRPNLLVGGSSGTFFTDQQSFRNGFIVGGNSLTLTATGTAITGAQLCDNDTINIAVANGGGTGNLSLPTAPQAFNTCLLNVEDKKDLIFHNTSSSGSVTLVSQGGSSTVTVASGTTADVTAGQIVKATLFRSTSGTQPWFYILLRVFK